MWPWIYSEGILVYCYFTVHVIVCRAPPCSICGSELTQGHSSKACSTLSRGGRTCSNNTSLTTSHQGNQYMYTWYVRILNYCVYWNVHVLIFSSHKICDLVVLQSARLLISLFVAPLHMYLYHGCIALQIALFPPSLKDLELFIKTTVTGLGLEVEEGDYNGLVDVSWL